MRLCREPVVVRGGGGGGGWQVTSANKWTVWHRAEFQGGGVTCFIFPPHLSTLTTRRTFIKPLTSHGGSSTSLCFSCWTMKVCFYSVAGYRRTDGPQTWDYDAMLLQKYPNIRRCKKCLIYFISYQASHCLWVIYSLELTKVPQIISNYAYYNYYFSYVSELRSLIVWLVTEEHLEF